MTELDHIDDFTAEFFVFKLLFLLSGHFTLSAFS